MENAESDTEDEETLYFRAWFPTDYQLPAAYDLRDEVYSHKNDSSYNAFEQRVRDTVEDLGTVVDIIYGGHHEYDTVDKTDIWLVIVGDGHIEDVCVTKDEIQLYQHKPFRNQHIHPMPHSQI